MTSDVSTVYSVFSATILCFNQQMSVCKRVYSPQSTLTTSGEEHQVTREEAGGGADRPAVQEVDHVAHCVSRSEEGLKVHAAKGYRVLV